MTGTTKEYFYEIISDDAIYSVYPNPANSSINISYQIFSYHNVKITVYDILGRKLDEIVNEPQESGIYRIDYNISKLGSGIYFLRLNAFNSKTVKFIVMK